MQTEQEKNILLASVSRSFYLTIRALPKALRPTVRTAYLLARAADTIADTSTISVSERLTLLETFRQAINEPSKVGTVSEIAIAMAPQQSLLAEKILMTHLVEILQDFTQLEEDREDVRWVLGHITEGQKNDLLTFDQTSGERYLADDATLERYTWQVAGCVGEFWTRICARKLPRFARLSAEEMFAFGGDFGKGLQLVNILRDVPEDLAQGRSYLPKGAEYEKWLVRAGALLANGWKYVLALRSWRLRLACALPVFIGIRTLVLLGKNTPTIGSPKIKITRAEVRSILFQTMWRANSNRLMENYRLRLLKI